MSKLHSMNSLSKINLTLLKKMVDELNDYIDQSDQLRNQIEQNPDVAHKFILEMQKATGLVAGIIQESTFLMKDISTHVVSVQNSKLSSDDNSIWSNLLESLNKGTN